jgi:DME family drug/metabolite transporter
MSRLFESARAGRWSILSAATLWGTTGVVTEEIYHVSVTNPLAVAFWRVAIGAGVLLLVCWRWLGRSMWRVHWRDALLMTFLGAMQAVFQLTYLAAIPNCGVTIATLIALCIAPVIVVVYSVCLLHERISISRVIAMLCAVSGTCLLSGTPTLAQYSRTLVLGVFLSLICAGGYAAVLLGGRALSTRYHPLQVNAASFGIAAILLCICGLHTPLVLHYPTWGWALLLYLGCVPTALAYVLFQAGLRSTSATLTGILTMIEPLTATLLSWVFLGEHLSLTGIVGALLLLGTIILSGRVQEQ